MHEPLTTCSDAWAELPAAGTAADASFWVALEQNGPWGKKAFVESRLDPSLGARLQDEVRAAGGRALLVRDPAEHPEQADGSYRAWVAGGPVGHQWVAQTRVQGAAELLDLLAAAPGGMAALATAPTPPVWLTAGEPILLVCTNGKRDRCCAIKGGAVARSLAQRFPGRVWEATHLGGHRFATTTLSLPSRQMLARVDDELGARALAEGPLPVGERHDRGLTHLTGAVAAADVWVREQTGESRPERLGYEATDDRVTASHVDGRSWLLRVTKLEDAAAALPSSCGVATVPLKLWQVTQL